MFGMVMWEEDKVLMPKETAWFGFYTDSTRTTILNMRDSQLYKEDWIGIQTLDK
jgi:palmitoyl-protein thioesterase